MTMSRNTSVKHLKFSKVDTALSRISNSTSFKRNYVIGERDLVSSSSRPSCLRAEISKSEIQVVTEGNINGIQLNIFTPRATHSDGNGQYTLNSCGTSENVAQCLAIDVLQKMNDESMMLSAVENGRRMSSGHFSYISFKKCDSLLHITIGNTSKIAKRRKRASWLFARILKFSHRKAKRERKSSYDTQLNKHSSLDTCESNGKLKLMNDELSLEIYNKPSTSSSVTSEMTGSKLCDESLKTQAIARKFLENLSIDEIENGANELDLYMKEVKRRERKRQI